MLDEKSFRNVACSTRIKLSNYESMTTLKYFDYSNEINKCHSMYEWNEKFVQQERFFRCVKITKCSEENFPKCDTKENENINVANNIKTEREERKKKQPATQHFRQTKRRGVKCVVQGWETWVRKVLKQSRINVNIESQTVPMA